MQFLVKMAESEDVKYSSKICEQIKDSAKARGTGIAKRSVEYIENKIIHGHCVIAKTKDQKIAGFCYLETFGHGKFVANSGLIVFPEFRNMGLAHAIKQESFELSRELFPNAKLFGLTTNCSVMGINSKLGYKPVSYAKLTDDDKFWNGCKSCVNYQTLVAKKYKNCLCTAMLFDPIPKAFASAQLNYSNLK